MEKIVWFINLGINFNVSLSELFAEHFLFQTTDFLSYYVLPQIRLTSSFDDDESVATLLGPKHPLKFVVYGTRVRKRHLRSSKTS